MHRSFSNLLLVLSLAVLFIAPQAALTQVTVAAAVNVASYTRPEFPNGQLAQGVMFTLFGEGMGPAALVQASEFPLPVSLEGTSVRVTVNGTTVDCIMIFTVAGRVAAILPSTTPIGAGTLTVTYNGVTSPPLAIVVVAHSFGIFTTASNGLGQGSITDPLASSLRLNGLFEAAHPGELWDIWGTGVGAASADESQGSGAGDLAHINVEVYVGGKKAQVLYRGRSGCCSGVDQIRIIIPEGVEGCNVSVVVIVEGVPSNYATMSIASEGSVCSDTAGPAAEDLEDLLSNGELRTGQVFLARFWNELNTNGSLTIQRSDSANAAFLSTNLEQTKTLTQLVPDTGSCIVSSLPGLQPAPPAALDVGGITLGGAVGPYALNPVMGGGFNLTFSPQGPDVPGVINDGTLLTSGSYTFRGSGGADVGSFEASVDVPAPVTFNSLDQIQSVSLNQPLTVTWSNGKPGTVVQVIGFSPSSLGSQGFIGAQFHCRAPAEEGSFTVPLWVLASLPPSMDGLGYPSGSLTLGVYGFGSRFSAPGIAYGLIWYTDSYGKQVDFR